MCRAVTSVRVVKMTSPTKRYEHDDPCSALTAAQQGLVRKVLARKVDKWGLWVLTEPSEDGLLRFSRL